MVGELGIGTKNGFIPFLYDELIQWAKDQGAKSPYKRLYTSHPPRHIPAQKFPRNRCGKLRLKKRCCCYVQILDADNHPQRPLFPTKQEIKHWKQSEQERKKQRQKIGFCSRPRCPRSKRFCALYPPPKNMATLQVRMRQALEGGEKLPMVSLDPRRIKTLQRKFHNINDVEDDGNDGDHIPFEMNDTALCAWFDQSDSETLFRLMDCDLDVPLVAPDEHFTEYSREEFFRIFGFEMETDYVPQFSSIVQ
jgi:hypothetical protein